MRLVLMCHLGARALSGLLPLAAASFAANSPSSCRARGVTSADMGSGVDTRGHGVADCWGCCCSHAHRQPSFPQQHQPHLFRAHVASAGRTRHSHTLARTSTRHQSPRRTAVVQQLLQTPLRLSRCQRFTRRWRYAARPHPASVAPNALAYFAISIECILHFLVSFPSHLFPLCSRYLIPKSS